MRPLTPLLLVLILGGCMENPAELPVFTPASWHVLIEEGVAPTDAVAFADGTVITAGDDGIVSRHALGTDPVAETTTAMDLCGVWGVHPDSTWAVGEKGTIVSNVSGTWLLEDTPTSVDLLDVDGSSTARLFAVGMVGRLIERRSGLWILHEIDGYPNLIRLTCGTNGDVHLLDSNGHVSRWAGENEKVVLPDLGIGVVTDILHAADGLWAVGPDGTTSWNGTEWARDPGMPYGGRRLALVGGAPCVIGENAWLKVGSAWVEYPRPSASDLTTVADTRGDDLVILQADATIHRRVAGDWDLLPTQRIRPIRDIVASSTDDVCAVGEGGLFVHWDGVALHDVDSGTFEPRMLWAASEDSVFCVGDGGRAWVGSGTDWVETPTGVASDLLAVWGRSAQEVYAAGDDQALLRWDGAEWTSFPAPECPGPIIGLGGCDSGRLYLLDGLGAIWWNQGDLSDPWNTWGGFIDLPAMARILIDGDDTMYLAGPEATYSIAFDSDLIMVMDYGLEHEALDLAQGFNSSGTEYIGYIGRNGMHSIFGGRFSEPPIPWPDHDYSAVQYPSDHRYVMGTPLGGLAVYCP